MRSATRTRLDKLEAQLKPPEQQHVVVSFGETDEAFAARIKQAQEDHPGHILHEVRVTFV